MFPFALQTRGLALPCILKTRCLASPYFLLLVVHSAGNENSPVRGGVHQRLHALGGPTLLNLQYVLVLRHLLQVAGCGVTMWFVVRVGR